MQLYPPPFDEPVISEQDREEGTAELAPKTCDYITAYFDSRHWNLVEPRQGDVLIGSYAKSGTTWMQQILRYLLVDAAPDVHQDELTMWVEYRPRCLERVRSVNNQKHRRFLCHHLPQSYLPSVMRDTAVYIYVARDGRDVVWSAYNHHRNCSPLFYESVRAGSFEGPPVPEFDEEPMSEVDYFRRWLSCDGYPWWPFWSHIRSWWAVRNHPRVLLVHYANLKKNHHAEIARIYDFLKRTGDVRAGSQEAVVSETVEHSTFDYMKQNADGIVSGSGAAWKGGGKTFVHKGTNGRWRQSLPDELLREYEATAVRELGLACAHWLATGEDDSRS